MLPGAASVITAATVFAEAVEGLPYGGSVVVAQHHSVGNRCLGHAGCAGYRESRELPNPAAASRASTWP
jgi:hypothetical protein